MYPFACEPSIEKLNTANIGELCLSTREVNGVSVSYYISEEFSKDSGEEFEREFRQLLGTFGLLEHYNELLYLTLVQYDALYAMFDKAVSVYNDHKCSKEMADLILFLNGSKNHNGLKITFSSPADKTSISEDRLTSMLINLINNEIDNWSERQPLMGYGETFVKSFIDMEQHGLNRDTKKLEAISRMRNPTYNKLIPKMKVELCLSLYPYLQNRSPLSATESTYSNEQYRFWFRLLSLLKLQNEIDSPEADYMSAMISNHTKK